MKFVRKQDLNALFQVCVFWADRKNKMAALASDWLRHFWLLLWNRRTEFSETWQEASSQCLLPCLCFSGKSEKNKMAALGSDWLRHFRLLLWNCERNSTKLDRKQDHNALYQVCVFQVDRKKKWPSWPMIGWDIFDFSYETTERNSTKLDRKQVLNVLYQVCVFRAYPKKQYGRPGLWLAETYFDFSSETVEQNSAKLDRKQDLNVLYQVCVFSGRKVNKNCHPGQSIKEGRTLYSGARYGALWASCLWIYLGEVRGVAPIHVYVWEHIVSLY